MNVEPLVNRVLDDEGIVGDLAEPDSTAVVEWLVKSAERLARESKSESGAFKKLDELCARARTLTDLNEQSVKGACTREHLVDAGWTVSKKEQVPATGFVSWLLSQQKH